MRMRLALVASLGPHGFTGALSKPGRGGSAGGAIVQEQAYRVSKAFTVEDPTQAGHARRNLIHALHARRTHGDEP